MSDITPIGFPEAARQLGIPLRILRRAIRAGRIPAPPSHGATASLSPDWLASAKHAAETTPGALSRATPPKCPAFARYEGTSAWRKYPNRVREYNQANAKA